MTNSRPVFAIRLIAALGTALLLGACSSLGVRSSTIPTAVADAANIAGVADDQPIRYWGDAPADLKSAKPIKAGADGTIDYLSLSGGGIAGAYGAGYLVGWTQRGDRPDFEVVTGISIGAMIAPMAFLGSRYDDRLQTVFADLATARSPGLDFIAALLGAPSLASNRPVISVIARLVDAQALNDIAAENAKGRRLLIGTTNLDAERPVIWDIGAIASSNLPNKLALVRQIILASASIPGVYPPVLIDVAYKGYHFNELHVDGGVTQQVVLLPGGFKSIPAAGGHQRKLYVIFNGTLAPTRETVQFTSASILQRATMTLLKYRGRGDIANLISQVKASGIHFNLAAIPSDYPSSDSMFGSPAWLLQLYKYGYESGLAGAWTQKD